MYTDHRMWYLLRTVTILHVRQCETRCREWNRNKIQHRRLCVWWRLWSVLMGSTVHNPNKCPGSRPRLLQLRAPWQHAACSGGSGDGGSGQCLKSCNKDVWVWQLDHGVLRHTQPVTWAGWPHTGSGSCIRKRNNGCDIQYVWKADKSRAAFTLHVCGVSCQLLWGWGVSPRSVCRVCGVWGV